MVIADLGINKLDIEAVFIEEAAVFGDPES